MWKSCALALVLVGVPGVASAQKGGWIDVNIGVASSVSDSQTYTYQGELFQEPMILASSFPKPSTGASFDFGGGFMFTPLVGVGVTFTGQAHENAAGMAITVPHPFFFNASDTDAAPTAELLQRQEGGTHINVMIAPVRGRFQFRVFGGPSFFRLTQDSLSDIEFAQLALPGSRTNIVTITGYQAAEAEGTGIGFNAGIDAAWFFSRVVGVGGLVRVTRGTVSLDEPLSEREQDVTVGGIHFGGGLRLRF